MHLLNKTFEKSSLIDGVLIRHNDNSEVYYIFGHLEYYSRFTHTTVVISLSCNYFLNTTELPGVDSNK